MVLTVVLVFAAVVAPAPASAAVSVDVTCTTQFCEDHLATSSCPTLTDECLAGYQLLYPGVCNCCPYCFQYLEAGEVCSVGAPAQPLPSAVCGPGLTCKTDNSTGGSGEAVCMPMETACAVAASQDLGGVASWPAQCDDDGLFLGAQCVPNGLCYCVEKYSGTRIFGDAVFESLSQQQAMTCGCSRAAWTASQLLGPGSSAVARCMPDGSFDTLQCVQGLCVCVDPDTGAIDEGAGSIDVNELDANTLPCFDSSRHFAGSWETSCERERRLALQIAAQLEAEGVVALGRGTRPPTCDPDGSYHRLQLRPPLKECVDAEGNLIEEFAVDMTSDLAVNMDCKCARTRHLLRQTGSSELPVCCPNGSFRPWQCRRSRCYCVSGDGAQTGADVPMADILQLTCFTADSQACVSDSQGEEVTTMESTTLAESVSTTAAESVSTTAAESESTTVAESVSTTAAESESTTAAESVSTATAESESTTTAESVSTTAAESDSTTAAESVPTTAAESVSTTAAESVSTTTAESVSTTTAESVPTTAAESESTTAAESVWTTTAESVSTTAAESVSTTAAESVSTTAAESESTTTAESVSTTTAESVSTTAA